MENNTGRHWWNPEDEARTDDPSDDEESSDGDENDEQFWLFQN